jgi:hypothetical protein
MNTFLNLDLGGKTENKFVWKHLVFTIIWILTVTVLIFRVDVYAINSISQNYQWIIGALPIILVGSVLITIFSQKWYYSVAVIFYPILLCFWFIPKQILDKGKIYLFSNYLNYVYKKLSNLKSTIIHFVFFTLAVLTLVISNGNFAKIGALIIISYFYLKFILNYLKSAFKPAEMFGSDVEDILREYVEGGENSTQFLETIIKESKEDEKLTLEERNKSKLRKLVLWNYGFTLIGKNLNGFKGKKAYVLSWVMQLFLFLLGSIIYFLFINYQLYQIDQIHFSTSKIPNLFDFLYYTLKTITFGGIDSIKPESIVAKLVEISSFFVLGILVLVVIFSVIFSLRQDKIQENIVLAKEICDAQNLQIVNHVHEEFGISVKSAIQEFKEIKVSVENLRRIINKWF